MRLLLPVDGVKPKSMLPLVTIVLNPRPLFKLSQNIKEQAMIHFVCMKFVKVAYFVSLRSPSGPMILIVVHHTSPVVSVLYSLFKFMNCYPKFKLFWMRLALSP